MFLDLLLLFAKKNEIWNSLYFFYARALIGRIDEQDNSAADIMVHSVYIYVLLNSYST